MPLSFRAFHRGTFGYLADQESRKRVLLSEGLSLLYHVSPKADWISQFRSELAADDAEKFLEDIGEILKASDGETLSRAFLDQGARLLLSQYKSRPDLKHFKILHSFWEKRRNQMGIQTKENIEKVLSGEIENALEKIVHLTQGPVLNLDQAQENITSLDFELASELIVYLLVPTDFHTTTPLLSGLLSKRANESFAKLMPQNLVSASSGRKIGFPEVPSQNGEYWQSLSLLMEGNDPKSVWKEFGARGLTMPSEDIFKYFENSFMHLRNMSFLCRLSSSHHYHSNSGDLFLSKITEEFINNWKLAFETLLTRDISLLEYDRVLFKIPNLFTHLSFAGDPTKRSSVLDFGMEGTNKLQARLNGRVEIGEMVLDGLWDLLSSRKIPSASLWAQFASKAINTQIGIPSDRHRNRLAANINFFLELLPRVQDWATLLQVEGRFKDPEKTGRGYEAVLMNVVGLMKAENLGEFSRFIIDQSLIRTFQYPRFITSEEMDDLNDLLEKSESFYIRPGEKNHKAKVAIMQIEPKEIYLIRKKAIPESFVGVKVPGGFVLKWNPRLPSDDDSLAGVLQSHPRCAELLGRLIDKD